jgi:outer membrane protein
MIGSQLLLCQQAASSGAIHQTLPLKECLRVAMEKNHSRPASAFAIAVAEAQHRQSLAGYWPQITAKAGITRMDEPLNFMFPASQMYIPPSK